MSANQNGRPSSEPPASCSLSPPLNTKRGNETGVLKGQRVDRERREALTRKTGWISTYRGVKIRLHFQPIYSA